MKLVGFCLPFSLLLLLGLTVAGQEAFQLVHLYESNPLSPHSESVAISLSHGDLPLVSSSVLAAEGWLKTHVLAHFPSANITTIVVGKGILCNRDHEKQWSLVLPSVKNLYYCLVRWGLVKEIKVSAAFSYDCFSSWFGGHSAQDMFKHLLSFLHESNSAYTIDPSPHSSDPSMKTSVIALAHRVALKRLGLSRLRDIRVIEGEEPTEPISRKLSSLSFPSFPEKPKPLGFPVPSRSPSAPSPQFAPVPDGSFSFAPETSPDLVPAKAPSPTIGPPPVCLPAAAVPAPGSGEGEKVGLWCVAKPTVPAEKLQEAIDFACGEGGADCEEIRPNGNCYYPDNQVAHASYAFNSYWQKTKNSGGSCSFDGTAILINSDPSFLHCRFLLS